jgi:hypothetical protein
MGGDMTDDELTDLAKELFRTFARFEYALKEVGFHMGEGDATPDWRRFALSIEQELEQPQHNELAAAIEFLLAEPPNKQMVRNGALSWEAAPPQTNSRADLVLIYVRRVRNNLFHGGKFNVHWFDRDRSGRLIENSLIILRAALAASPAVRAAYG